MPALASSYLRSAGAESTAMVIGENQAEKSVRGYWRDSIRVIEIHGYGSSTGFDDLAWGTCHIAMSSKPIDEQSVARLSKFGDMTSASCEHVLALDGIAIIVNQSNPLSTISLEQAAGVFSGRIDDWGRLVGGGNATIIPCVRDENSGTHEVFKHLVLRDRGIAQNARICLDNKEMAQRIQQHRYAIGYVSLTFTGKVKALRLTQQGIAPIKGTLFNVLTEDYPLSRRLFLYTPEKPENNHVQPLISFALSPRGQAVVEQQGFVAQIPKLSKPAIPEDAPGEYRDFVDEALRVSMNFRFKHSIWSLDSKSVRSLSRLIDFLAEQNLRSTCTVLLAGFTDNSGDAPSNLELASKRAAIVANMLHEKSPGMQIRARGFGQIMPIASNLTPQGREKNRRVEVWLQCDSGDQ